MSNLQQTIDAKYRELVTRERAAAHLKGIPRSQNATAIARLYDELASLNLQLFESR